MAKKTSNRYKLMHKSKDGVISTLCRNGKIKDNKFTLTQIDAFTTHFVNQEDMVDSTKNIFDNWTVDGKFWIEYQANKRTNKLQLVYSGNKKIAYLSNKYKGKYTIESPDSLNSMYSFLTSIKDPEVFKFLKDHKYISDHLLKRYYQYKDSFLYNYDCSFYSNLLEEVFSNYKTIRDIEVGLEKYSDLKLDKLYEEQEAKVKKLKF